MKQHAKKEIEEQLETLGDWLSLKEEDYEQCDNDIACQDGGYYR